MIPASTQSREEDITAFGADSEYILWAVETGRLVQEDSSGIGCEWVDIIVHNALSLHKIFWELRWLNYIIITLRSVSDAPELSEIVVYNRKLLISKLKMENTILR